MYLKRIANGKKGQQIAMPFAAIYLKRSNINDVINVTA